MAEFPTPTILGSSSNGRTSRLQRENARSIRVDSMGLSSKGKTPRSLRGDACSSHASSTSRGDARFYFLVGVWGHRPMGGHQAGSLGMRVRFPLVPLHRQRAGREPVSKTSFAGFESLVACTWKVNVGGPRPGWKPERAARLGFRVARFPHCLVFWLIGVGWGCILECMPWADRFKTLDYQRRWLAERRRAWFSGKVCAWCGTTEDLQLDHIDPKTKISHRIFSLGDERRLAELAKCQVLCGGCHKKKTFEFDTRRTEHGASAMYQTYKCRCSLCREWKRLSNKKYRIGGEGESNWIGPCFESKGCLRA
jgi:hypothetical protein